MEIFLFHKVSDCYDDRWTVKVNFFKEFIEAKLADGIKFVTEKDADRLYDSPTRHALIHFDDGYTLNSDIYRYLIDRGIPFTIFIVSDLIGDWNRWDFQKNLPELTLLNAGEITQLNACEGVTVASHTCSHTSLVTLERPMITSELGKSREILQKLLGCDIEYLSYPFGDYNEKVLECARAAGYKRGYIVEKRSSIPDGLERFGVVRNEIIEY